MFLLIRTLISSGLGRVLPFTDGRGHTVMKPINPARNELHLQHEPWEPGFDVRHFDGPFLLTEPS